MAENPEYPRDPNFSAALASRHQHHKRLEQRFCACQKRVEKQSGRSVTTTQYLLRKSSRPLLTTTSVDYLFSHYFAHSNPGDVQLMERSVEDTDNNVVEVCGSSSRSLHDLVMGKQSNGGSVGL
jgi:hypothetical protein